MTRETKIGLLVGLAFIIVIGILLSDHLTSTNEPQQAQLAQVAGNVRTGVAIPGAAAQAQQARLWVVVRDGRGGVGWIARSVEVTLPAAR